MDSRPCWLKSCPSGTTYSLVVNAKLWDNLHREGAAYTTPSPSFRVRLSCQK